MYKLQNGILYRDGKPTLGIGVSYYASYHPEKRTLPPGADAIGEMRLDVRDMAQAGFNHIRTAANGAAHWEGNTFCLDTSFTDALLKEVAENGMCSFVRIEGYSMNQRHHQNVQPLDQDNQPLDREDPYGRPGANSFVADTLNNPALNADMDESARQQAAHFAAQPEVLGFQIYNEPTIQRIGDDGIFDYHPDTIAAFRKWLAEKGYMSAEEAERADPPRAFPKGKEDPKLFGWWRQFGVENMSAMLCRMNRCASEAAPGTETFTNFVCTPMNWRRCSCEGDWFACSRGMDILGLDIYANQRSNSYYWVSRRLDEVESAAAAQGKHAWIIEYCCRTHMRVQDYEGETYAALGSGYKGINYYLWRADLGGPEVQLGGMVWNDRSKTAKYDEAVKFNHMLAREGEKLASCEKLRSGAAILYSLHGIGRCESMDGYTVDGAPRSRWYRAMDARYQELKKAGITADFIQAEDLKSNPLGTELLFVPCLDALDEKEKKEVAEFARGHAVVLHDNTFHPACGTEYRGYSLISDWCYRPAGTYRGSDALRRAPFRMPEILRMTGIRPVYRVTAEDDALGFGFLRSSDGKYDVACLLNINSTSAPAREGEITADEKITGKITKAVYVDRNREEELPVRHEGQRAKIGVPTLDESGGCLVYLYRE